MVELKVSECLDVWRDLFGFNRSMVELKDRLDAVCMDGFRGFNRSMVELKEG